LNLVIAALRSFHDHATKLGNSIIVIRWKKKAKALRASSIAKRQEANTTIQDCIYFDTMTIPSLRKRRNVKVVQGVEHNLDEDEHDIQFDVSHVRDSAYGASSKPKLRKSGSSLGLVYFSSDDESDFGDEEGSEKSSILASFIPHAVLLQFNGIFHDFCDSGLPWKGYQCRSLRAGGSGCLYALPALATSNRWEQAIWITQAILSVWADYFNSHHSSFAHGVDRVCAFTNLVQIIVRGGTILPPYLPLIAITPISCFMGAGRAKKALDLEAWHWWHFGWHLTGGICAMLTVYLMHHCPDLQSDCGLEAFLCRPDVPNPLNA
jgi:hypothetical protein